MTALWEARLYTNPQKCKFYQLELDFLGHHISAHGIEAKEAKCTKILDWPVPQCVTDVCAFLGLVRYIAQYLPQLAEPTRVLNTLTMKEATAAFPDWSEHHQAVFDGIKHLVTSRECLTSIDHVNPGD